MLEYPVPLKSSLSAIYASNLSKLDPVIVPTKELISEASGIFSALSILGVSYSLQVVSAFPSALQNYLKSSQYANYNVGYFPDSTSHILVSQLSAVLNYNDPSFSSIILSNPGRIIFMKHLSDSYSIGTSRIAGQIINGFEYFSWYKYMRSHCHYGVKSEMINEHTIEFW